MTKSFAYSFLTVKEVDEEKREIRGMASTPEVDRQGDIVEPKGAEFANDIPLLWQHDSSQPVGRVKLGKATKEGIPFTAKILKFAEPAGLKARVDEAWQSVKSGLVSAVSIGFRAKEYSIIEETGGLRFTAVEIMELSLVTIPANAGATIQAVKSADFIQRAALGVKSPSGVTEKKNKPITITPKEGTTMKKTYTDQLKSFADELDKIDNELDEILEKSAEDNSTPDAATEEREAELTAQRDAVVKHIERIKAAQKRAESRATPLDKDAGTDSKKAAETREGLSNIRVSAVDKPEKGINFARYAMCVFAANGDHEKALKIAQRHYAHVDPIINALKFQADGNNLQGLMMTKANVAAGTTLDSVWAAPLVQYQNFAGDFVEFLRPRTIIGQFGQGNIPSLNRIPFNVRIAGQDTGGTANWVGEGKPKPLTKFDFSVTELRWFKIAAIAAMTEELMRFSDPSAERLVRDALAGAVIERMDIDFVNPAKAAVSNVSPASITNGISGIASSGSDADAIRCDLQALWQSFIQARIPARTAVYIMTSTTALALSLMRNALGQAEFPGITINGGTLEGIPVIVSDYVPSTSAGSSLVILANANDIWLADDGQVTIDMSREASLQFLDNPTNDAGVPTATTMTSLWQTNSVGLKAERFINWARRRDAGVAYLTGVNWGACGS